MGEHIQPESVLWPRIPHWHSFDMRAPTPDYLDTGQYYHASESSVDDKADADESGMFGISVVPAAVLYAEQESVNRPLAARAPMSPNDSSPSTETSPSPRPTAEVSTPSPQPRFSRLHDAGFIFTVCMAQFLSLAGLAQSVAPLFIIGDSFEVSDPGQLSWYTAAYSLTVGTFILPAGRLGDMYGHKKMFLLGWSWFGLWAVIAGFSVYSGSALFNAARGFQGIGPAILVPNAMALIGKTYPVGFKKNMIFSAFGAGGPTGFVVGVIFSALIAQLAWWPWAFWALGVAAACLLVTAALVVPADVDMPPKASPRSDKPASFDWPGAVTGVGGLVLINFAWNQGPVVGWDSPYVYSLLIVGFILMIGFFITELYLTENPLIPIRGLGKDAGFALACIGAGWGSHGIWIYYIFWFLLQLRKESALLVAAQTSPVAPAGAAFALSVGLLMRKMRPAYIMTLAMAFFLVGSILIATAPIDQIYWSQTFLSIIIMPGGMNLSFPAGTILLSNALPKENQGIAASLVSTTVNYSISIGLGFAGTINRYVTPDPSMPGGQNVLRGFRGAWWFGTGLDGLGLLIALYFVWNTRPSRDDYKAELLRTGIQHKTEKKSGRKRGIEPDSASSGSPR